MVYLFGTGGFVLGFAAGLFIVNLFLRSLPREKLLKDKSLRRSYGLAVWIIAGFGAWIGVWLYERSFY